MAILFLTSSPTGPLDGSRPVDGLDSMNHFIENLKKYWKPESRNLMITAFPENIPASEEMTGFFHGAAEKSGLSVSCFDLLDDRRSDITKEELQTYDVIWLGGGHVPTQNAFFRRLDLRSKLEGYEGIIIGISAGTMNSADLVYSEPEEPGEALDPSYQRWIRGLGLTDTIILPHYQMVKNNIIDGLRLYEDIVYPDSIGHRIINLTDGSYILRVNGIETLYGEAYLLENGQMSQICQTGFRRE